MKKIWLTLLSAALMSGVVLSWNAGSAQARPPYEKAFREIYGKDLKEPLEKVGEKDADTGKVSHCAVCHVAGKKKEERNEFGQALAKNIMKKEGDAKKIKEAIEKTAGETKFADLIKAGKLPGGN